jgi:hypothetical protein
MKFAAAAFATVSALASVPALALSFAFGAAAPEVQDAPATNAAPSKAFQKAAGTPMVAPTAFDFESNGFSYHVSLNGNGWRTKGDKTRRFNLHLDNREEIRRLYFSEYEGDVLLLCETDDSDNGGGGASDGGGGAIWRLEQPSMRARWKQRVPTPGGINTLREGASLYVAGRGFIARLDLKTGEYAWRHGGANDVEAEERQDSKEKDDKQEERQDVIPAGFYGAPEVAGDTVTFREDKNLNKPPLKAVQVDKKSGKIIRIE